MSSALVEQEDEVVEQDIKVGSRQVIEVGQQERQLLIKPQQLTR